MQRLDFFRNSSIFPAKASFERVLFSFVAAFVVFIHLLLGSFLYFQSSWSSGSLKKRPSKIVVQTIALTSSIKTQVTPSSYHPLVENSHFELEGGINPIEKKATDSEKKGLSTATEKKAVPSITKKPLKKETIKKENVKRLSTPSSTKKIESKQNGEKQKRLAEIQKKIASIQTVSAPSLSMEGISNKNVRPSKELGSQGSYADVLIDRLRKSLEFPEYGKVDIELTLDRSGKVLKIKILSDESQKNRQYVEKMVPQLKFSPFGLFFPGESSHTFVVSLHNEL